VLRGKRRGWQPSGTGKAKQDGRRRFWFGLIGWSGVTTVAWVGLCLWRMMTMDPANFLLLFCVGVFHLVVLGRVLIQPRAGVTA